MIPLDKNESYWLLDGALGEDIAKISPQSLSTYPDYTELKEKLAEHAGTTPSQIVVTAGSDATIIAAVETLMQKGGQALLPVPTFYGYEKILDRMEREIVPLYYSLEGTHFAFPMEELRAAAAAAPVGSALFLCHPSNPLSNTLTEAELEEIASIAETYDLALISDEAYFEYGGTTLLSHIQRRPECVLIIRTMSKAFGLAGARVGYGIGSEQLVQKLSARLLPWPISHPSVEIALNALGHAEEIAHRRHVVSMVRDEFTEALKLLPTVTVYPSVTNFLLIRVPDAAALQRTLSNEGMSVASGETMTRFEEARVLLQNTLRVATPRSEEIPHIIEVLHRALQNSQSVLK